LTFPAIDVANLNKRYRDIWAVRDLNLTVSPGEVFALVGPNGAGKTTTIKILMGLIKPTSGRVKVLGLDPQKQPDLLRIKTGYAVQQIALDLYLTARENLDIFADLFNIPPQRKAARIEEMLSWADLSEAADRLVQTYSGGMKRRLNLVLGLLQQPELLFLDEPTLGLDIQARRQLWDMIQKMKSDGTTIILTTHYLEEANELCDRVGIMTNGHLAALGTPSQLKRKIAHDLLRLTITFDSIPPLDDLSLPISPEVKADRLEFVGPHDKLWQILRVIQDKFSERVLEATYLQPTLDDVVLKIAQDNPTPAGEWEKGTNA
jgi:ABC-2 type transport system ATP-binding protein